MHPTPLSHTGRIQRKRAILAAACLATFVGSATSTAIGGEYRGRVSGHGPIYSTLDAFAGGIEKLLGLDGRPNRACGLGCDEGCDALSMHELRQMPVESWAPGEMGHPGPMYMHEQGGQYHPEVSLPAEPQPMMQPGPGPAAPMRMSPHRMSPMNRPVPMQDLRDDPTGSGVTPHGEPNNESIFDTLQDPFQDDSARIDGSKATSARPASYRTSRRRVQSSR